MIISWHLLKNFIKLDVTPEEAAERLSLSGAEVEYISRPEAKIKGVTVARVDSLKKHHAKEHLLVAELNTCKGEVVCVTAAKNLKPGDMVFYGAPGSTLADGKELSARSFDGVESAGMMLSAAEMGLPDVDIVEGILTLPKDALVGSDATTLYGFGDTLLDVSITPNRGDLLSVLGMARELHGLFPDSELLPMPWEAETTEETIEQPIEFGSISPLRNGARPRLAAEWPIEFGSISLPDPGCINYNLGLATDVTIAPSPVDVRVALSHLGMRPISNIVDATNYVMLTLGQPLHAFDLNTLPAPEVTVRAAFDGEKILTLDGKERVLTPADMLITSGGVGIGLAGVMGGSQTGIADDTKIVLLEGANFSARRVGHTSRRLGLTSEASFRYARGVDPTLAETGVDYALYLMRVWSGAKVGYRKKSAVNAAPEPKPVSLTKKKLDTILLWSDMDESAKILEGFGLKRVSQSVSQDGPVMSFTPPTWRPDITIEEDLIEEIGRFRGYNDAPDILPGVLPRRADIGAETVLAGALRGVAIARGYVEAITYSFLPERFTDALHLPHDDIRANPLTLANPISQDWMAMRTTLIPGLLAGLKESLSSGWREPVRIFEVGRIFLRDPHAKNGHREEDAMAGLVFGGIDPRTPWKETRDDFLSVKGDVEAFLASRGQAADFVSGTQPFGHTGQTADIVVSFGEEKKKLGFLARLSPAIEREMDFTEPVYVFEIFLAPLETPKKPVYSPASQFPAAFRDISMLAPLSRTNDEVIADIRAAVNKSSGAKSLLESVRLFDVYSGKGIPEGLRSLAFAVTYRAKEKTLQDEDVDGIHNAARDTLTQKGYSMR
ncbi:phenylalanine--tRNA ligase beta subunit [Synergistales bacterium]|nr:phenylalanine--tRNA ligase beta subunit [Synergistales bacterium]